MEDVRGITLGNNRDHHPQPYPRNVISHQDQGFRS